MHCRTATGYRADTHANTNTETPTQTHTDALSFRHNTDLRLRRQVPWKEQKTETPASPEEMSAAVDEPGSAVKFLERLASLLLIRLLVTESRLPLGCATPRWCNKAGSSPSPGCDPSESSSSRSHSTHTHTHTHTHTFLPALEGLEGGAHASFSWRERNVKASDTGWVSVSPAGDKLGATSGLALCKMGEWISGPGLAMHGSPGEVSGGPAPLEGLPWPR